MSQGVAQKIIQRCTQFDPAQRYQSVEALMKEIQKLPERFPVEKKTLRLERHRTYRHNHNKKTRRLFSDRKGISGEGVSGWRKWLPPGFRTLKFWKMCVAGLAAGCCFWCWCCSGLIMEGYIESFHLYESHRSVGKYWDTLYGRS